MSKNGSTPNSGEAPDMIGEMDLDDYARLVRGKTCNFCGGQLSPLIDAYPHTGGWLVKGFDKRQWLSANCGKCHYDWSLWKLDIPGDVDHLPVKAVPAQ